MDRTDCRTLFSGAGIGTRVEVEQAYCKNECGSHRISGRAPAGSLGGSLGRQDGPWTVDERDWN